MSFTCQECSKKFEGNYALKNHVQSTGHNTSAFFCEGTKCGRRFESENALNSHKAASGHFWVSCSHQGCRKTFPLTSAMQAHVESGVHARKKSAAKPVKASNSKTPVPISKKQEKTPNASMTASSKVFVPTKPIPPLAPSVIPQAQRLLKLVALQNRSHFQSLLRHYGYSKSKLPYSPQHDPYTPKRAAVCIDCEMVGVRGNRSELAYISVIDVLTGDVLINRPVQPQEDVRDWRTSLTGLTPELMQAAATSGAALFGWETARAELWKYIDERTVIVGHALQHDLKVLRMRHRCIVDSQIMSHQAVGLVNGNHFGLKKLCEELLNRSIQQGHHSALEDAFAAREVVLWCIDNIEALENWADMKKKASNVPKKPSKGKGKKKSLMQTLSRKHHMEKDSESEGEILFWDVIEEQFREVDSDSWSD